MSSQPKQSGAASNGGCLTQLAIQLFGRGCVAILLFSLGIAGCRRELVRPRIAFDAVTIDAGQVFQGQKVQGSFSFANNGQADLRIDDLMGLCQCTAILAGPMIVPPGGRGTIVTEVDSTWLPAAGAGGRKDVVVTTNDPILSRITLSVLLKIVPEFAIDAPVLDFGVAPAGERNEQVLTIRRLVENVAIIEASSEDARVTATIERGTDPQSTILRAVQERDAQPGWYIDSIRVRTSSKYLPEFRIPLRGRVGS